MSLASIAQKGVEWIKANPGYAIGGAGGAGFIAYLVYKQAQTGKQNSTASGASGTQATDATSQFAMGDLTATPTYDYLYGYYQGNPPNDTGTTNTSGGSSGGTDSGGDTGSIPIRPIGPPTPAPTPTPTPAPDADYVTVAKNQSFNTLGALYGNYPSAIKALNPAFSSYANHDILPVGAKIQVKGSAPGYGIGNILSGWNRFITQRTLWGMSSDEFSHMLN